MSFRNERSEEINERMLTLETTRPSAWPTKGAARPLKDS
jgi:hypothetical protein